MKPRTFQTIMIIVFIGILITLGFVFKQLKSDGTQCLIDPFLFHTKELAKTNEASISCACTALKPGSPRLEWTDEGYINEKDFNLSQPVNISQIDFSLTGEYKSEWSRLIDAQDTSVFLPATCLVPITSLHTNASGGVDLRVSPDFVYCGGLVYVSSDSLGSARYLNPNGISLLSQYNFSPLT